MARVILTIMNPGGAPADNARTIHALKLAASLRQKGAEVKVLFAGKGTTWLPRFINRTDESHPFVRNYGPAFDAVRDIAQACNMCTIRFDTWEAIQTAGVPIVGEGRDHVDLAPYILDGWQVINF